MLKLVLKAKENISVETLLTAAFALAHYKATMPYKFDMDYNDVDTCGDYDVDKTCFWANQVLHSPPCSDNFSNGMCEYEIDSAILDPFLMERLVELQKIAPFEMYFENRGKYDAAEWMYKNPDYLGEIYDEALGATCSVMKSYCAARKRATN